MFRPWGKLLLQKGNKQSFIIKNRLDKSWIKVLVCYCEDAMFEGWYSISKKEPLFSDKK